MNNLSISTTPASDGTLVRVVGEVDVSNASDLRDAVDAAIAAGKPVEVDLAEVGYIDSTGIGVLVGASRRAEEAGIALSVANPQPNVKRVLGLLGVEKELKIGE